MIVFKLVKATAAAMPRLLISLIFRGHTPHLNGDLPGTGKKIQVYFRYERQGGWAGGGGSLDALRKKFELTELVPAQRRRPSE